ncbi:hypothetical protein ACFL6S_08035 [Candidatus Poribacteria bacterium]
MCRKHLILAFTVLLAITLAGCGFKQLMPSKKVPPLEGYSTIVLLPFDFDKPVAEYETVPTQVSYSIGTKLTVRHQDKIWSYDQSQEVKPVSEKLTELNMSPKDIFEDPLTATKVAEVFQADLIIVGKLDDPKFTREDSGKVKYDMQNTSAIGADRFYTIHQTAILPSKIKVIDAKANQVIWDGTVIGYRKYETDYRTGSPKKFMSDETMMADIRKDLVAKVVEKLYPKPKP